MHLFAAATALMTFVLLFVGGVVTSRDAGMIFSDWPLSNGSLNPAGWLHHPDQRAEHLHRLLGALVGLMTIALAIGLHRWERRKHVRVAGYAAVGAVCLQGLLGGLRVTENSPALALVHGCSGQAFFGLMIVLACFTSRDGRAAPRRSADLRGFSACAAGVAAALYVQIVLGAQLRHSGGPVNAHLLGALLVAGSVLWLLTLCMLRHSGRAALRRPTLLLTALLIVQAGLGFSSLRAVADPAPYGTTWAQVLLPTAHQSVGALMFVTSLVLVLRSLRRMSPLASKPFEVPA